MLHIYTHAYTCMHACTCVCIFCGELSFLKLLLQFFFFIIIIIIYFFKYHRHQKWGCVADKAIELSDVNMFLFFIGMFVVCLLQQNQMERRISRLNWKVYLPVVPRNLVTWYPHQYRHPYRHPYRHQARNHVMKTMKISQTTWMLTELRTSSPQYTMKHWIMLLLSSILLFMTKDWNCYNLNIELRTSFSLCVMNWNFHRQTFIMKDKPL